MMPMVMMPGVGTEAGRKKEGSPGEQTKDLLLGSKE